MLPVNHALPPGMVPGPSDRLSLLSAHRMPSGRVKFFTLERPYALPADAVRHTDRRNDAEDLAAAVGEVTRYLAGHPGIAESSFGKAVRSLLRGATELATTNTAREAGALPPEAAENLSAAAGRVEAFLESHPLIARSPFGQAVSRMQEAVAAVLETDGAAPDAGVRHRVTEAADAAQEFLGAHPAMAGLPLGRAVAQLIDGVAATAGDGAADGDIQILARRVGHFVGQHPRLADSEFGLLVAELAKGVAMLASMVPSDVEPLVAGDTLPNGVVPAASDVIPETETTEAAALQKAA